jgi:hypothetical protein
MELSFAIERERGELAGSGEAVDDIADTRA